MRMLMLLPLLAGLVLAAGCALFPPPTPTPLPPGWTEVPFTSIEREDVMTYDRNQPNEPVAYLLDSQEDVHRVQGFVRTATFSLLKGLNYDEGLVLIVTWGQAPGLGYYVEVQRIAFHDGVLTVYAHLGDPRGQEIAGAMSSPYHAVWVARSDVPGVIASVQLEVETVIVTPTPIPTS